MRILEKIKANKKKSIAISVLAVALILVTVFYTSVISVLGVGLIKLKSDVRSAKAEVKDKFETFTYTDEETGLSIPYGLYIPENYDETVEYPMITFIGDMGSVGDSLSSSLSVGLGGTIWATSKEQAKHESFVLIPQFPEVILDDHDGYTMTEYVDLTERLIEYVADSYSIDADRIYGTGQSMGCMTTIYLAANYPELYAAELFIDGQWNINEIQGLSSQKFIYVAAGGDEKASAGQQEVKDMLSEQGLEYNEIKDVNAKADNLYDVIGDFLETDYDYNFITFETGTVLPWYVPTGVSEHMYSFDYGYRLEAARDWLFEQTK